MRFSDRSRLQSSTLLIALSCGVLLFIAVVLAYLLSWLAGPMLDIVSILGAAAIVVGALGTAVAAVVTSKQDETT